MPPLFLLATALSRSTPEPDDFPLDCLALGGQAMQKRPVAVTLS
jgi:hypothetical protein